MNKQGKQLADTTPFRNRLLDTQLSKLKGSEWKLLCLIVRQTSGWSNSDGTRKQSDWLTHRQIKERTGLASASVCRAIDTLVKRRLIAVRDASGKLLMSSEERRRARHLHFSLRSTEGKSVKVVEIPFQKVKTTKESNYIPPFVDFINENGHEDKISKNEMLTDFALSPEAKTLLDRYQQQFKQHRSLEDIPEITASDLSKLQAVVDNLGTGNLDNLIDLFFVSNLKFIVRQHYSLASFCDSVHILSPGTSYTPKHAVV